MNQGARDANAESARMADKSVQDQILAQLKEMNQLLRVIASHVQPDGAMGVKYYKPLSGTAAPGT